MSRNGSSKQKTLFQAWEGKVPVAVKPKKEYVKNRPPQRENKLHFTVQEAAKMCTVVDLTDELDDEDLLEAVEVMESSMMEKNTETRNSDNIAIETIPGFDNDLGSMWIYPTNYPVRDYQYSIVKSALFKNTLVSLPTGLGKTFIAAVVMYNFYRWYPQGKVVFMAPTKPLVSQQIEACYNIMGIPYDDQAEITGMTTAVHKREELWRTKRVFFLTPQVINNDLARGVCPATDIKCVVIDEAHKAQGRHAYCQVINQLAACSRMFRVLALSATPGTDVNSVQQVIHNLLISHIEIRSEESLDIRGYSHHRKIEKVVCKLDETMVVMRNNYLQVIELFTNSLVNKNALYQRDTASYSKYGILLSRDQFRKNPPSGLSKYELGAIEGDFATCISLFHGFELLQQHGMRSFYIFLKAMMEGEKGSLRAKTILNANQTFRELFASLVNMFGNSPNPTVAFTQAGSTLKAIAEPQDVGNYVYSHPKIRKLEEVVLDHFANFAQDQSAGETRVMVFCQYRDTVQEITELLQKHRPMVRPMQFVGHSNASGKIGKFTQKDQLKVVSKFRAGGYNTLISTCVGEEGLDIGDVDLIVCFDAHKSPIRLVQRMGRTGRKREGRIVMLVTEGKEERDYNSSVSNRKSIQKAITGNSSRSLHFYPNNPRMVPRGLNPQPLKMAMTVKARPNAVSAPKKKKTKSNNMDISLIIKNDGIKNPIYLTTDQVKEWDEKFKLSPNEKMRAKLFPACRRIECLGDRSSESHKRELSFAEWNLWQVRLQGTHLIGHSSLTKHFVEMMNLCDHLKQSETVGVDLPHRGCHSTSTKQKSKPSKQLKSPNLSHQPNLENFIMESLCDEDDTFVGIESIIDEDVHEMPDSKNIPDNVTQRISVVHPHKTESKILPSVTQKAAVQNRAKVDPLLDFINDLSEGSCDELSSPQQENSGLSNEDEKEEEEQDDGDGCKIFDSLHGPEKKFDHPSPPELDSLHDSFDDAQNFDGTDCPNFTQTFDFNFDDEEDLFCNPQFECTSKMVGVTNSKVKSDEESKLTDRVRPDCSGFGTMADGKKLVNANLPTRKEVVLESHLSNDNKDLDLSLSRDCNKKAQCHSAAEDYISKRKERDKEITTVVECALQISKSNPQLRDTHIHHPKGHLQADVCSQNIDDKDSEEMCSNSQNFTVPNFDFNSSIDMFSPNFDFGMGIDCADSAKCDDIKEGIAGQSPILSKPKRIREEKGSKEDSPGHITITQKVENRVLFAELGKSHDASKTLIAQVKPQLLSEKVAAVSNPITTMNHEHDTDQELPFLLTRHKRRSLDNSENIIAKRKKEITNTSKKVYEGNKSIEDSPLLMRKNCKSQNKILVFSPESDKSGYSSDKDKFMSSYQKKSPCKNMRDTPVCKKRRSDDGKMRCGVASIAKKHSTPKAPFASDDLSDEDFKGADTKKLKIKTLPQRRISSKIVEDGFVDFEADVSQRGPLISTDEDEGSEDDQDVLEEMKDFVNDASVLTQHVGQGPAVDERAMYLRGNADFFGEGGQFGESNAKFKLAFNVRSDIDVYSQETNALESDYEQDSFVCDDVEPCDSPDLGEITLLDQAASPILAGKLTRRQVELNRLKKFNKESSVVAKNKNKNLKKGGLRKRIMCFDDSMDSLESGQSSESIHKQVVTSEKETGWTCPACTLLNKPNCLTCGLCDCEKPLSGIENQPVWTCKSCTYINHGQHDVCNMCGKLRSHNKTKQKTNITFDEKQPCASADACRSTTKSHGMDSNTIVTQNEGRSIQNTNTVSSHSSGTPAGNLEIEERLKRVLKKRLDFKAKRESLGAPTQVKSPKKSDANAQNSTTVDAKPSAQDFINSSIVSSPTKSDNESGPIVVLVDSKELSSSQPIITMLRTKFQANVTVASLPHCDYIVGIGTAVARFMVSDISHISSKQKLSTKFQQLNVHYDRVYAVIEQDLVKKGEMSKRVTRTSQFMAMTCRLAQCNIRVLYSENQEETAGILNMLAARERNLKRAVAVEAAAKANDPKSRLLLKLFLNMPKVSFVSALYMCLHFKTFKEAASSSVEKLIQKAHMSTYAAAEVYTFCRRKFDIQMTPTR